MTRDQKSFGKYEPGNKVYYDELDQYFGITLAFATNNKKFKEDIVPLFKVVYANLSNEP